MSVNDPNDPQNIPEDTWDYLRPMLEDAEDEDNESDDDEDEKEDE